jgi:hypothetical protein
MEGMVRTKRSNRTLLADMTPEERAAHLKKRRHDWYVRYKAKDPEGYNAKANARWKRHYYNTPGFKEKIVQRVVQWQRSKKPLKEADSYVASEQAVPPSAPLTKDGGSDPNIIDLLRADTQVQLCADRSAA